MAVSFTNSPATQPISGQEVTVCTLVGPRDNLDAYISGGQWIDGELSFRLYATVGGVVSKVAEAPYVGPVPAKLKWDQGSPLHVGGTLYTLKVFANPNSPKTSARGAPPIPTLPALILATLAGVNNGDIAVVTNASAVPVLPSDGSEVTVGTAPGFIEGLDTACDVSGLPNIRLNVYASCGGGSVQALVASQESGADSIESLMLGVLLPVATLYTIKVQKVVPDGVAGQACPTSLSTMSDTASGGGGGPIALTGNANGPSNANTVQSFVTSTANADVHVAAQAHPSGLIYEGLNGLTANRTVFLNTTATGSIGDETTVKDEDGSLALWNIVVDPGAGNTIDGAATYTMTAVQNGIKGAASFKRISATAWAIV